MPQIITDIVSFDFSRTNVRTINCAIIQKIRQIYKNFLELKLKHFLNGILGSFAFERILGGQVFCKFAFFCIIAQVMVRTFVREKSDETRFFFAIHPKMCVIIIWAVFNVNT